MQRKLLYLALLMNIPNVYRWLEFELDHLVILEVHPVEGTDIQAA